MRNSIFISYRRDDSSGYTQALFAELRRRFGNDRIFLDVSDIKGGDDFVDAIEQAGFQTRVLLAIIGAKWLSATDKDGTRRLDNPDDYVRREIATALSRGIRVIPVLVNDAEIPETELLPEELQVLTNRSAIEIRHSRFDDDVRNLAQTLEDEGGIEPLEPNGKRIRIFGRDVGPWQLGQMGLLILGIVFVIAFLRLTIEDPEPFAALEDQGFEINGGFSGNYLPGNIVKTTELDRDGNERTLPSPLVFMRASHCFPDQSPTRTEFIIPATQYTSSGTLKLGQNAVERMLPTLDISGNEVVSYSLGFDDTYVQTFALADLSGAFSDVCVDSLSDAFDAGDRPEFYGVIVEAVMAEGLSLDIDWQSRISANAKLQATTRASEVISRVVGTNQLAPPAVGLEVAAGSLQVTTISAKGPVLVAYRVRPIQPRFGPDDE